MDLTLMIDRSSSSSSSSSLFSSSSSSSLSSSSSSLSSSSSISSMSSIPPSLNPRCLEIWLYLKISHIAFILEQSNYPYFSLTGELPCLKWGREPVRAKDCLKYVKDNFCDLDEQEEAEEDKRSEDNNSDNSNNSNNKKSKSKGLNADFDVFRTWLYEVVDVAHKFLECSHLANDTYAQAAPVPVNWILREQNRRTITTDANSRGITNLEEAIIVINQCYLTLSNKLGQLRYFSKSDRPSSLDVAVASRIASHYHSSISINDNDIHTSLRQILEQDYPFLVSHSQRVLAIGFPELRIPISADILFIEERKVRAPAMKSPTPRALPFGSPPKTYTRPPTESELARRAKFAHGVAVLSAVFVFTSMAYSSMRKDV